MAKRIRTFYLTDEVIDTLEERARQEEVSVSFIMENLARAYCDLPQTFSTLIEAVKKASPQVTSEMDTLQEEKKKQRDKFFGDLLKDYNKKSHNPIFNRKGFINAWATDIALKYGLQFLDSEIEEYLEKNKNGDIN